MKNLVTRSLAGIVFVVVTLGSLLLGKYGYALFFLFVITGGLFEFYNLTKKSEIRPYKFVGIVAGILLFILSFFVSSGELPSEAYLIFFPFLLFFFIAELYRKKEHPTENIASGILGIIYIAVPLSLSNLIVFDGEANYSPDLMIALLVLIWIYDSGAYLFGVSMGKHRLFERISPKKSWEGALGGILVTLAASFFMGKYIDVDLIHWLVITLLMVIISTFGDLSESLLKRQFGLKDSGQLIPGHGGLLDRFDSFLFSIPVFVCYLKLFVR